MQWFKFYGQEYLIDPKIISLTPSERSCWITLLCYGSVDDDGMVKYLSEEQLMVQAGIIPMEEEWKNTIGILEKFKINGMITYDNGIIIISNWGKRQEKSLTNYQRVKRYRAKHKNDNADNEMITDMITTDKNRIEENRKEYNNIIQPLKNKFNKTKQIMRNK